MEGYPVTVGRYEILRPLAEGGFGQVYLARMGGAAGFHRTVAIKRIRFEYTSSPDFVADFIKEARIGGYLQHHNVVQVFGFDQIGGHYLLIMEFVDGIGLDNVVNHARTHGEYLPIPVVAEIVAQAADGLQYIHTLVSPEGQPLQLIHRDLKPSNLLIGRVGLVKITDFGVARAAIEGGKRTQVGAIKGTLAYLSPEQARGEPLDYRSDLYSLGTILYELLTLDRLFGEDQPYVLLGRLGDNKIEDQLSALPARALPFQPLLRRLLTVNAAERIGAAREVAEELRSLGRSLAEPGVSLSNFAARLVDAVDAERHGDPEVTSLSPSQDPMIAWTMTGHGHPVAGTQKGPEQTLLYGESDTTGAGLSATALKSPAKNNAATRIEAPSTTNASVSSASGSHASPVAGSRQGRINYLAIGGGALLLVGIAGYLMFGRSESEEVLGMKGDPIAQDGGGMVPGGGVPGGVSGGGVPGGVSGGNPGASNVGGSQTAGGQGPGANLPDGVPLANGGTVQGGAGEGPRTSQPGLVAANGASNTAGQAGRNTGNGSSSARPGSAVVAGGAAGLPGAPAAGATNGTAGPVERGGASSPGEPVAHAGTKEEGPKEHRSEEHPAEPVKVAREPRKAVAEPGQSGSSASTGSPGRLIVTSRPSAQVYVDGKSIGETPLRGIDYPPGNYTIRLSRPDLQFQQTTQVQIKPGGTVRLTCMTEGCDVTYP